jgi:hypothetical protein
METAILPAFSNSASFTQKTPKSLYFSAQPVCRIISWQPTDKRAVAKEFQQFLA